ncbi:MAG: GNAT family N-acetyltransferase, partial [Bacteroidota bacterium]
MLTLNFSPFPLLYTERLILRQVTPADAPDLFLLRSDKEVMKYIDRPLQTTVQDALLLIQKINDSLDIDESITWA